MTDNWDDFAERWDDDPDAILYSRKAFKALLNILDPVNLRVLDLGCGTGLLAEKLASSGAQVIGIDTSEKMISVLGSKNLQGIQTEITELSDELIKKNSLFSSKFDLVVASSVCAFLPDYVDTLKLVKVILAPNGKFIQWDWLSMNQDDGFGLTEEIMESAFVSSGLQLQSIEKAFTMQKDGGPMDVLMGVAKNA